MSKKQKSLYRFKLDWTIIYYRFCYHWMYINFFFALLVGIPICITISSVGLKICGIP